MSRRVVCGAMLLILAASRTAPVRQPKSAAVEKQANIYAGDFLASPENCGLIHSVRPVYPKTARKARMQGVVKVEYVITKAGSVRDIRVLSGAPGFVPAALTALSQRRFAPYRVLGSEAIERKVTDLVSFSLNQ